MSLHGLETLVFMEAPSEGDKLQAKARFVRWSEMSPAEQERLRNAIVYTIAPGTIDDHLSEVAKRKLRAIRVSEMKGRP